MKRDLFVDLCRWKQHPLRKPLIIRGARQVGKSWLVNDFSSQFEHFIELNFDKDTEARSLFTEDINIKKLLERISYYTGIPVIPGKTLLFIDEIQECENALRSLRYFKEDYPELHVIAAGSLLDFAIEKVGVPVGRVQFLYLYPLSFAEYLTAIGRDDLRQMLFKEHPKDAIHTLINEHVKNYSLIGGLPDVVQAWIDHQDLYLCQEVQDAVINTYRQDIEKYTRTNQVEFVELLFNKVPMQLGGKFVYSHIDNDVSHYQLKNALRLLKKAGIITYCYHSAAQGFPISASKNLKKFKVFFFDIGLAQRSLGVELKHWVAQPILPQYKGSIAEQYVAQQLIAHSDPAAPAELYYWHREQKSSNAEVDFIVNKNNQIFPVEVKSGERGRIKSLRLFLQSHQNHHGGIKFSNSEYRAYDEYQNIPFYSIEAWLSGDIG